MTTDHVLIETWLLLNSRYRREIAERFLDRLHESEVHLEIVTAADLQGARAIGASFPDQSFSIVDRTSFAVMERLGINQAASFDNDFAIYRYGRNREKALEIIRTGHSSLFRLFHRAIVYRSQIVCVYQRHSREICPIILGHKDGVERALVYQFGGMGSSGAVKGEWKCLNLAEVKDAKTRYGPWHSGDKHRSQQRCVDEVFIDVNTEVPNQPGRRPELIAALKE